MWNTFYRLKPGLEPAGLKSSTCIWCIRNTKWSWRFYEPDSLICKSVFFNVRSISEILTVGKQERSSSRPWISASSRPAHAWAHRRNGSNTKRWSCVSPTFLIRHNLEPYQLWYLAVKQAQNVFFLPEFRANQNRYLQSALWNNIERHSHWTMC